MSRGRLLVGLLVCIATVTIALAGGPEVVVIASPTVADEVLSYNAVRLIFGMRLRNWRNGDAIRVYTLRDDDPVHAQFCRTMIGVYPHQLRLAWDRLVFSGTGQAPVELASVGEMLERVASTPGAVGYLPGNAVDARVRVLRTE